MKKINVSFGSKIIKGAFINKIEINNGKTCDYCRKNIHAYILEYKKIKRFICTYCFDKFIIEILKEEYMAKKPNSKPCPGSKIKSGGAGKGLGHGKGKGPISPKPSWKK